MSNYKVTYEHNGKRHEDVFWAWDKETAEKWFFDSKNDGSPCFRWKYDIISIEEVSA